MEALGAQLRPCGPVVELAAAQAVRLRLDGAEGAAWPALAPAFAASPYLAGLAGRDPPRLARLLAAPPEVSLDALVESAKALAGAPEPEATGPRLRALKSELHLLAALADLGGVWDLDAVTGALSRFADAAVGAALATACQGERARGRLGPSPPGAGPACGLFVLALGKHGALELNYSSDIDVSVFYDPAALPVAAGQEPARVALRITQAMARLLSERVGDDYVFRTDLRLRPDPASTPVAVPVGFALGYYEAVGQNWERAALIKARVCAGDAAAGAEFLAALHPFVWRRALDYAAIADIHSIKRQIHAARDLDPAMLEAAGADLKLGPGGIREIEFFVQTQQLILGGRRPDLRTPRTLDALEALHADGRLGEDAAAELACAYRRLRGWEHRAQMIADAQTHRLPEAPEARRAIAALAGAELEAFDAQVRAALGAVNARYAALFEAEEPLSSALGSLVFTGVEDDPATLATLARMGFSDPAAVSGAVRSWHHGRIPATRTPRGRQLFTRLAPRLLEAARATGAPDLAFLRFSAFFSGLSSGVAVQSLLLAQPGLFDLLIGVLTLSPRLAATLADKPAALDALLDPGFFDPASPDALREGLLAAVEAAPGFEGGMDAARRAHREEAFRIGVQVLEGAAGAEAAGAGFAALADACIAALAPRALAEVERLAGAFPGEVAVIGLGKLGGREMTAESDLDLMTVHRAAPGAASAGKGWGAETVYARFTQRLAAALSAPTAEGGLYKVDLQLRPSGTAGPVSVSLPGLEAYYAGEAQTWEFLALTRARVIWASDAAFGGEVDAAVARALRRVRDPVPMAADVRDMRALMARERPAAGAWDLKLAPGGLVDIEFAAQALQLRATASGGPLRTNTGEALSALRDAAIADPPILDALAEAWRLQQALSQVLRLALPGGAMDPAGQPARLRERLAAAAEAADWTLVAPRLAAAQAAAHAAFEAVVALPVPDVGQSGAGATVG